MFTSALAVTLALSIPAAPAEIANHNVTLHDTTTTQECVVEPRTSSECVFLSDFAFPTQLQPTELQPSMTTMAERTVTQKPMAPILSAEAKRAFSKTAKDKRGFEPSLYRGKWWNPKWKDIRHCIMDRESSFSYWAANPTSSARGAYQFLDSKWRQGLIWMMLDESKKTGDGLQTEIKKLRKKPIDKWSRYFQDRAFYTALRHGKGLFHWKATVPGTHCF